MELLQEKAEEVHLGFSVTTEKNHDKKACIRLGFESIKEVDMS